MARINQITDKADVPAEYHGLFDRIAQARGSVRGPYSSLLHSPAITDKVDALAATLREGELNPQEFVLGALSAARAKDCLFVWSVQAPNARKAGIPDSVIYGIRERKQDVLSP